MATSLANERLADPWTSYVRWNNALAEVVYNEQAAGMPVYLDLEDEVLRQVAAVARYDGDDPRQGLVAAVQRTLNTPGFASGIFGTHLFRLRSWNRPSGTPPPCIGLLAVLSLAAEDMGIDNDVAPNNYYERLMPLLGFSDRDKKRVVAEYRQCSQALWDTLNGWLEDLGGERGLPTAYSTTLAHVGPALSQALVRAADRRRFEQLFVDFGLPPRTHMSTHDMHALLSDWMARDPSPASRSLQDLWRRPGAKDHVAEAACLLLEAWDGPRDEPATDARRPARSRRAALLAHLRTFPRATLELNVIGTGPLEPGDERWVDLLDGGMPKARLAVEPLPVGGWRLADPGMLDTPSLLEGRVSLRRPSGQIVERHPRRLVVLRRDPLLQAFIEVERVFVGEDCLLLCHAALEGVVDSALHHVARPGFVRDASVPGCPPGWVVFSSVQVLVPLPAPSTSAGTAWPDDLNALTPLTTTELVLEGGLQLPGRVRRWSSLAPPEARVAAGEEGARVTIRVEQVTTLASTHPTVERSFDAPVAVVPLAELGLSDGDYRLTACITVSGKQRPLDSMRFKLRSGDNPVSAIAVASPSWLIRDLTRGAIATLTADRVVSGVVQAGGALVSGDSAPSLVRSVIAPAAWWQRRQAEPNRTADERSEGIVVPNAGPEDCIHTGAHHILLPVFRGRRRGWIVEGTCKHCGLVKRYPTRLDAPAHLGGTHGSVTPAHQSLALSGLTPAPAFDVAGIKPVELNRSITPDVALDALTHLRGGNAGSMEQVALQVEPSPLFVDRFLRNLEALGHVEVARDLRTFKPTEWEIAAPALVELPGGGLFLAGARSRRLCRAVEQASLSMGATIERTPQTGAPARITIRSLDPALSGRLAARASRDASIQLVVAGQAARRLAACLPPLSAVLATLRREPLPGSRSIRRWDPELTRWDRADDTGVPGGYHLVGTTRLYCLRDAADIAAGTMRRADARLVKHAMALERGETLVSYHKSSGMLVLPLGAELPALYARAAVLASGLVSVEDTRHRLVAYRDVPVDLAEHLVSLLSS